MLNRETTHIVKTDSLSDTQLIVETKYYFCYQLMEKLDK